MDKENEVDSHEPRSDALRAALNAVRGSGTPSTMVIFGAFSAATFGPMLAAFCTELGKRLGGSAADWASRVQVHHAKNDPGKADLVVEAADAVTAIEISEDLTDDAKLALLDLDIDNKAIRGHRLRWDDHAAAWTVVDSDGQ
jgi:hypothetical protein